MQRANVRGANLDYEIVGSGEPVLLIHGALMADGLRPLAEGDGLAERYQLIVYHRAESQAAMTFARRTR